jgi:6,7-dimethyl-8-ribityllumazine synthase
VKVPGAWELTIAAKAVAESQRPDAIVALGAVIRGDTPHFDFVAGQAASGLMAVQLETGIPVAFGVLTTNTMEQAMDRAGGKDGNKGYDAAITAIEMASLLRRLRK